MPSTYNTVRYNDTGENVKRLQTALNSAGHKLEVDGIFGEKTLDALKQFQTAQGLTADGVAGEQTWGALQGGANPSGNDTSAALYNLMTQYNSNQGYTPKTAEEIKQQATDETKGYYDQLKLSAQQQHQANDLRLQQQQQGLQAAYDKQREQSAKQYAQVYSQSDRQMLSRGMQRSSYAAQTLANISLEGAEAQQAIADQQAAAEGDIAQQRTLLAQQLAAQLGQYDANQAADVINRIRELESQEYDRGVAAADRQNSLATQLYQFLYQQQRDDAEDQRYADQFAYQQQQDKAEADRYAEQFAYQQQQDKAEADRYAEQLAYQQQRDEISDKQWQMQFDEDVRRYNESQKKSSGGSRAPAPQTPDPNANPLNGGMSWTDFLAAMGADASTAAATAAAASVTAASAASKVASSGSQFNRFAVKARE